MNKKISMYFLSAILCLTFLGSCSQTSGSNSSVQDGDVSQWSEELEYEIKQAYYSTMVTDASDFTIDRVSMLYYGSYSGYEAVINNGLGAAIVAIVISIECGGHMFQFASSNVILLYKDGVFINFDDAFKEGKISQEDIDRLYEVFSEHYPIW